MSARIYLDHHATTPCDPRVVDAMAPWWTQQPGNPASPHLFGWEAAEAIQSAQVAVASLLNADPKEVVFTSSATESNNLAIHGVLAGLERPHVVTSTIEHPSVLEPIAALEQKGARVTRIGVDSDARVDLNALAQALDQGAALCSVQAANGEVGTVQPLAEIGEMCTERGVVFHTDATQAVGKIPVDAAHCDLLSLSAHKFHGPKGVGALVVSRRRPRVRLTPLLHGGAQQWGIRPGTVPVPLAVGLAEACNLAAAELSTETPRLAALRDRLWAALSQGPGCHRNGPTSGGLPQNLSVRFLGVEAQAVLLELRDIAFSSGSACTADQHEPSPVLLAMGVDSEAAHCTLRFGVGRFTTEAEVDEAAQRIVETVSRLRDRTPRSLANSEAWEESTG